MCLMFATRLDRCRLHAMYLYLIVRVENYELVFRSIYILMAQPLTSVLLSVLIHTVYCFSCMDGHKFSTHLLVEIVELISKSCRVIITFENCT